MEFAKKEHKRKSLKDHITRGKTTELADEVDFRISHNLFANRNNILYNVRK